MAGFKGNPLPSAVDAARIIDEDESVVERRLREYYKAARPPWNYNWVKRVSKNIYSGDLAVAAFRSALEQRTRKGKVRAGIEPNVDVALLLRKHSEGRVFQCFDIKPRKVFISRQYSLMLNPPFYFVEGGIVKIFWLQPRKQYALNDHQAGVLGSLLRLSHFRDDFSDAKLELFDASAPDATTREPRKLGLDDLPRISEEELTSSLRALLIAYERVKDINFKEPETENRETEPASTLDFEALWSVDSN